MIKNLKLFSTIGCPPLQVEDSLFFVASADAGRENKECITNNTRKAV